jgi:hypothetical protein
MDNCTPDIPNGPQTAVPRHRRALMRAKRGENPAALFYRIARPAAIALPAARR